MKNEGRNLPRNSNGREAKGTPHQSHCQAIPHLGGKKRWDAAAEGKPQPEPICKIAGKTLAQPYRWLYLVPDDEAGLGWVAATEMHPRMAEAVIAKGGWADSPSEVPTVIL